MEKNEPVTMWVRVLRSGTPTHAVGVAATLALALPFGATLAFLAALAGCHDAAWDRNTGGRDGGAEVSFAPESCAVQSAICEGRTVRACAAGQPAAIVEICDEACSRGRCTTPACATAETSDGTRGCLFYGVQVDNVDRDDAQPLMLAIANSAAEAVEVRVEVRAAGEADGKASGTGQPGSPGEWVTLAADAIPAKGGTRLQLQRPVTDAGVTAGAAFRVQSQGPVMVLQLASDDTGRASSSSGGTILRPVHALGTSYIGLTFPQIETPEVAAVAGSRGGAGTLSVVATRDATQVTVVLKVPVWIGAAEKLDPPPPSYDVTLDEGEVLQIFSATPGTDLSGTYIQASAPIALFAGNVFTSYGRSGLKAQGGDLVHEQLPPLVSWSRAYVGAWHRPQAGCDSYFGAAGGLWTVLGGAVEAQIGIRPAPGVVIEGISPSFTLHPAETRTFVARGDASRNVPGDFYVVADEPFLLAQWLDCEPGLSLGMDARLSRADLTVVLPPAFDHEIVLVRNVGTPVVVDGRALARERFRSAVSDGALEIVRLSGDELGQCADHLDRCEHTFSGEAFGMALRGMDVVCSYATAVPPWYPCVLPAVLCPE